MPLTSSRLCVSRMLTRSPPRPPPLVVQSVSSCPRQQRQPGSESSTSDRTPTGNEAPGDRSGGARAAAARRRRLAPPPGPHPIRTRPASPDRPLSVGRARAGGWTDRSGLGPGRNRSAQRTRQPTAAGRRPWSAERMGRRTPRNGHFRKRHRAADCDVEVAADLLAVLLANHRHRVIGGLPELLDGIDRSPCPHPPGCTRRRATRPENRPSRLDPGLVLHVGDRRPLGIMGGGRQLDLLADGHAAAVERHFDRLSPWFSLCESQKTICRQSLRCASRLSSEARYQTQVLPP